MKKSKRLILALDVENLYDVERILDIMHPHVDIFKIGPRLFIPYGKKIVNLIKKYNSDIFLDLKLYDIPTQVASSVKRIADIGVRMFTVHTLGGEKMLEEAKIVLNSYAACERPLMLAVTILTSLSEKDLHFLNFRNRINIIVFKLAKLALSSGADGIVCSVKDVKRLKENIKKDFIAVVPGIRTKSLHSDQQRHGTAQEAFKNGADYIVVGRSIIDAKDPLKAIKEVLR